MADGRHFENRKIAISQWKIVRFWWNLVHYIRYWTRLQSRDQKLKFFEPNQTKLIPNRVRIFFKNRTEIKNIPHIPSFYECHFVKFNMAAAAILKIVFLAINHRPIVRFQRNFVRGSRTACRQGLDNKNRKFLKSKMADGRHFENR